MHKSIRTREFTASSFATRSTLPTLYARSRPQVLSQAASVRLYPHPGVNSPGFSRIACSTPGPRYLSRAAAATAAPAAAAADPGLNRLGAL